MNAEIRLKVTTLIVELTEMRGPARQERREALAALHRRHDIVPLLIELVRDDTLGYDHRGATAQLLADWRAEKLLPVLDELLQSGVGALQETALAALFRFGDPAGIDGLIALLDHPDQDTAWRACDYLGESRSPRGIAPLVCAIGGAHPMLRRRAVDALARYGTEEAYAALESCSRSVLDPELAARIHQALTRADRYASGSV